MYNQSDDSYFFAEFLKNYLRNLPKNKKKELKFLDLGCGSGILSQTALDSGIKKQNVLASDINKKAADYVKNKLNIKAIQSNLFSKIKQKFNLIAFNAPYLPEDKNEPKESRLETTGGKRGDEISLKFIKQAKQHLKKQGKILLLISSLTPINKINKLNPKIIARKKLFMEELLILEIR